MTQKKNYNGVEDLSGAQLDFFGITRQICNKKRFRYLKWIVQSKYVMKSLSLKISLVIISIILFALIVLSYT